ncbi:MAG: type 2 lantipeptide synthetase LanM family protein [Bacteroidales bacterium]|nr:type 2 lantipeptide synthetase LanM family protein [Bacteroidales bacterium]
MSKFETPGYFDRIAAKASGLQERIDHYQDITFTPAPEKDLERLRSEWKERVALGDEAQFDNRLKNDSISPEMLPLLLGEPNFDPTRYQPEWLSFFIRLTEFLDDYHPDRLDRDIDYLFGTDQRTKIPYIELITPFVAYASNLINDKVKVERERYLGPEALLELHRYAARLISYFTAQTFHLEFQVFLSRKRSSLWGLIDAQEIGQPAEATLYHEFIRVLIRKKFHDFFEEYATLARILSIILENMVNNTIEFLTRLDTDYQALSNHFHAGEAPGRLIEFKTGLSDRHERGKSVVSLQFESGLKLIYKPKNLEVEQVWSDFLIWFNDHGLKPKLRPLDVLTRGPYGWVGFIESAPCENLADIADFYRRTGSLVALIYLLNGNDCHHENLIASGAYPLIIDLESILQHNGKPMVDDEVNTAVFEAINQFGYSVLRTGLLPSWITGKDGYAFDISGIGAYEHQESPYKYIRWENINTDRMGFTQAPITYQEKTNIPVLNGEKHLPTAHQTEIMEGFTTAYQLLLQKRADIPIHLFKNLEVRFIFRATRIYGMIWKKLMNPKFLRSGLEHTIEMELLGRAFIQLTPPTPFWNICRSELRQMEGLDYPMFHASTGCTDLSDSQGVVAKDYLDGAVYHHVQRNLQEFCLADMEKQLKIIRASLFFRDIDHGKSDSFKQLLDEDPIANQQLQPQRGGKTLYPTFMPGGGVAVDDQVIQYFLDSAMALTEGLQREAIVSKDGSCAWMAVGILSNSEKYRMQPTSIFLYEGLTGIALFLSSLFQVTGDQNVGKLKEASVRSLFWEMEMVQRIPAFSRTSSIGITSGLSSVVYGLMTIAKILNDPSFLDKALDFSKLITNGRIANDSFLDIMSGSAGCALSMIGLHKACGDVGALKKARLCGDHLLEKAIEQADGSLGWPTSHGKMLTGFSHGAAGISYSLMKLFEITVEERYRDAAIRGIRYENSQFSEEYQNWYDLRSSINYEKDRPRFMISWCHGAAGIGLSRSATLHLTDLPAFRTNLTTALSTILKTGLRDIDHLCCGNLGRAESLFYAARVLHDEALLKEAYKRVFGVMERAKRNGHYLLFRAGDNDFFNPGFFQGVSGIGYQLLRMAYPDRFPAVLLFE